MIVCNAKTCWSVRFRQPLVWDLYHESVWTAVQWLTMNSLKEPCLDPARCGVRVGDSAAQQQRYLDRAKVDEDSDTASIRSACVCLRNYLRHNTVSSTL